MDDLYRVVVLDPVLPVVFLDCALGAVERFPVHFIIAVKTLVVRVNEVHLEVVCHVVIGVVKRQGASPNQIHAARLLVFVELLLGKARCGSIPRVERDFVASARLGSVAAKSEAQLLKANLGEAFSEFGGHDMRLPSVESASLSQTVPFGASCLSTLSKNCDVSSGQTQLSA